MTATVKAAAPLMITPRTGCRRHLWDTADEADVAAEQQAAGEPEPNDSTPEAEAQVRVLPGLGDAAEGEPQVVVSSVFGEETGAGDECHVVGAGRVGRVRWSPRPARAAR